MDRVEVYRSHDEADIDRAQRFLRNAHVQSWRGGGGRDPITLSVRPEDEAGATEVLSALDAFSKPLEQVGPPEDHQRWWQQPGTIPMLIAAIVLFVLVDYRLLVAFAIVAIPLLGVRVRATQQRGADRFAGPSVQQDRPRPRHRNHRLGQDRDDHR